MALLSSIKSFESSHDDWQGLEGHLSGWSAVHVGKLINLSKPVFIYMQNGTNNRVTSQDCCGGIERQLENALAGPGSGRKQV